MKLTREQALAFWDAITGKTHHDTDKGAYGARRSPEAFYFLRAVFGRVPLYSDLTGQNLRKDPGAVTNVAGFLRAVADALENIPPVASLPPVVTPGPVSGAQSRSYDFTSGTMTEVTPDA